MGVFGNMFKKSSGQKKEEVKQNNINWIPLKTVDQIKAVTKRSHNKPVGIFKHSTRCAISKTVIKNFDQGFPKELNEKIDIFYIDLLNYRDVSNEVGYEYQVLHQSPQFLLINKGEAVLHASHYDITQIDLEKILK
ncbi:bacillithiol system redox-active protein YtxJ [Tenacibaculum jejuense]|uniref:Bacillithiol system redox-active protein YtxJ n=1 Tax=Tenacibaculum jejuense TaxID=584609 RepID=A0A238UBU8_9FLAO|nr:bacillithiol system redox-active protein YtxJ [Tenacibaculum jejuense]SNR15954.1 Protein of unknown function YtxJ [Tenacibaculum jejuense]